MYMLVTDRPDIDFSYNDLCFLYVIQRSSLKQSRNVNTIIGSKIGAIESMGTDRETITSLLVRLSARVKA